MRSVASGSVPSGQILVKSGGNALQAVDQHVLEEKNNAVAGEKRNDCTVMTVHVVALVGRLHCIVV